MSTEIYQALLERLAVVTRADDRIAAAFVGGSRGAGTADEHADIDIYLILRDDAYDDFLAGRRDFMHRLGIPLLAEDFDSFGFDMVLFLYADGAEGELVMARESNFAHIPHGPFHLLVDKKGILPQGAFPPIPLPEPEKQHEELRWLVHWFWRDLSHLSRWIARGRPWTAYANLDGVRYTCLNLARLKHDWTEATDSYYKIEDAVDAEDLVAFQRTYCTIERATILGAVCALLDIYLRVAPPLAIAHGVTYPADLHRLVLGRLEQAFGVPLDVPIPRADDTNGDGPLVQVRTTGAALG